MKKGRFSLSLSIIIMVLGLASVLLGVLSGLGVLPQPLSFFALNLARDFSITGKANALLEFGAFLCFDGLLILILRGRRPFSMFIILYIWPMYFTLLPAYRKISEISLPYYYPPSIVNVHTGLLFVLFVLEMLLAFVLLASFKPLDDKWRKKKELNRRMLEKEGILKTKESMEEEKFLHRQRKLKALEDKKRAKEEARYEKERQKEEKADNAARAKKAERDRLKYEKEREREEEIREKRERKLNRKALKEKDKVLEESQKEKERIDAKAEKIRKKKEIEDFSDKKDN